MLFPRRISTSQRSVLHGILDLQYKFRRAYLTKYVDDALIHDVEQGQKVRNQQSERCECDLVFRLVRKYLYDNALLNVKPDISILGTNITFEQRSDLILHGLRFPEQSFIDRQLL